MSKPTITLSRDELVWQTRRVTWDEEDWKGFVEWIKGCAESSISYYHEVYGPLYPLIKDMSWEDAVKDFNDPKISCKIVRSYEDGSAWDYTQTLADAILESMREDCYDADIYDENYADDYNEDTYIEGLDETEAQD